MNHMRCKLCGEWFEETRLTPIDYEDAEIHVCVRCYGGLGYGSVDGWTEQNRLRAKDWEGAA